MGRWTLSGEAYMITNKDREPVEVGEGVAFMPFWVSVTRARVEQTCPSGRFDLTLEGLGLDPVTRKPVDIQEHVYFSDLGDEMRHAVGMRYAGVPEELLAWCNRG